MDVYGITENGNEYRFECEFVPTRNGFKHTCVLYLNGVEVAYRANRYLNRTWERYEFQSVMRGAIGDFDGEQRDKERKAFMAERGYKRMTEKRREEFNAMIRSNPRFAEYDSVSEALNERPKELYLGVY